MICGYLKSPAELLSSSRMRGSILCSVYLWIPAYAGMTGESLRNPGPELAEGRPASSTGSLTVKSPGPELAEGRTASSTGSLTVKSPGPELAEGRTAALLSSSRMRKNECGS